MEVLVGSLVSGVLLLAVVSSMDSRSLVWTVVDCDFECNRAYWLLPRAAALQTLAIHRPGEPLPDITDETLYEESGFLLKPGDSSSEWTTH